MRASYSSAQNTRRTRRLLLEGLLRDLLDLEHLLNRALRVLRALAMHPSRDAIYRDLCFSQSTTMEKGQPD